MNKLLTVGATTLFICLAFTPGITADETNFGNTLYVGGTGPGNYSKIQEAINDASDGDTIFVYSGTYYENVIVNKTISLTGEDRNSTIIDGKRTGHAVSITAHAVTIMGFTVRNGEKGIEYSSAGIKVYYANHIEISNCNASSNNKGIYVYASSNTIIANNTVLHNNHNGILIEDSNNNRIENNTISNNSRGIELEHTNYSIITSNTVSGIEGPGPGIGLWYDSNHNIISKNEVDSCGYDGIELVEGSYNTIFGNNITGNGLGLECYIVNSGYSNKCNYNNFIDNTLHIIVFSPFPSLRKNNFDSNYWDNWPGIIPKPILGARRPYQRMLTIVAFDWCPLIYPYNG
jgi:parallel beta-helix repeat protein